MTTAAILALALAGEPSAWSEADTWREASFAGLVALDLASSLVAQKHGAQELNPFLGARPPPARVAAWCAGGIGLHLVVSLALPGEWRRGWQYGTIGIEAFALWHNGVAIRGSW